MAECTGLENRIASNGTGGSNPPLSALVKQRRNFWLRRSLGRLATSSLVATNPGAYRGERSMTDRKEEQADLLIQFGDLIAPLEGLVALPEKQTPQTRSRACAKFIHDLQLFQQNVQQFVTGELGHHYSVERQGIIGSLNIFSSQLDQFRDDPEVIKSRLADLRETVKRNILSIPCDVEEGVIGSGSPFTAYLKIRSICETAEKELVFVDPWMGAGTPRRYFRDIPESVVVSVITKKRSRQDFSDFLDLSWLYSKERGHLKYRLFYHSDLHDRYLKADDTVYHLGGSIKDAGVGSDFTITNGDAQTAEAISKLMKEATEVFGPKNPKHPNP